MNDSSSQTTKEKFANDVMCVLNKTKQLDISLQSLQSTNASLRFYCTKLLVKLKGLATTFGNVSPEKCTICFDGDREFALYPCGHLFCSTCVDRCIRRDSCFVCSSTPESKGFLISPLHPSECRQTSRGLRFW